MTQKTEQSKQSRLLLAIVIMLAVVLLLIGSSYALNIASTVLVTPTPMQVSAQSAWSGGGNQLVWGVVDTSLTPVPFKLSAQAGGAYGALDVYIQDQTSSAFAIPFHAHTGVTATLAEIGIVGEYTVSVEPTATHGIVASDTVYISNYDTFSTTWSVAHVVTVADGILSLDRAVRLPWPIGTTVEVISTELAIDGSGTRQVLITHPPPGSDFDVTGFNISMICGTEPDDSKFCDQAALSRGVYMRKQDGLTGYLGNLGNIKTNGDLALLIGTVTYHDKSGGGAYGVRGVADLVGNYGVTIRLRGSTAGTGTDNGRDELQFIIQDDLTSVDSFKVTAIGHIVAD